MQAIDVREVADRLVELALEPPAGIVPDIGGPEKSTWEEMIRQCLSVKGKRRWVVAFPMPGTKVIREGGLLLKDASGSEPSSQRQTWAQFVAQNS